MATRAASRVWLAWPPSSVQKKSGRAGAREGTPEQRAASRAQTPCCHSLAGHSFREGSRALELEGAAEEVYAGRHGHDPKDAEAHGAAARPRHVVEHGLSRRRSHPAALTHA